MARSKPRIGSTAGGIPTVIDHGVDGLLFESNNAEDLKDKLRILMSSESLRKKYAEAGRARFQAEFTVEQYGTYIKTLYEDVLS